MKTKGEMKALTPKGKFFDYSMLIIVLFLVAFGLVMVYSTSSYTATQKFGDAAYYLNKQLRATILGLAVMVAVTFIPYHFWYKTACGIYILSIVSVLLILIPGVGVELNGAKRWINVFGITTIQSAEIVKLGVIISFSAFCTYEGRRLQTGFFTGIYFLLAAVAGISLLMITRNLSSCIIVLGIAYVIYLVALPHAGWLYIVSAVLVVLGIAMIPLLLKFAESNPTLNFRLERLLAWQDPEAYASGKGYQTLQSLYAIGSGGFWGKGLGSSIQKLGFIPEAQNDMIFAVVCEELGIFGGICLIVLFILLLYRFLMIATNTEDRFGILLVSGVFAHIAIQVILNIAVVTNTIPNTGITLPFISYGGTSVMFLLIEMGIVLNVSINIRVRETRNEQK